MRRRSFLAGAAALAALGVVSQPAHAWTGAARLRAQPSDLVGSSVPLFVDSVAGNDANNGLTWATALRTHAGVAALLNTLDLGGQNFAIFHAYGTPAAPYVYDPIGPLGRLVGRGPGPGALTYVGCAASPDSCVIRPPAPTPGNPSDSAIHTEDNQSITVVGFRLEMTNNPGWSSITNENGCDLFLSDIVFGPGTSEYDLQACLGSFTFIQGHTVIDKLGTTCKAFSQQDPGAQIGTSSNGVFGGLIVEVRGTPNYSQAFAVLDRGAVHQCGGIAWLQAGYATTTFGAAVGYGYTLPVASAAGIVDGMNLYSPAAPYGAYVVSHTATSVTINVPSTQPPPGTVWPASTPLIFGFKALCAAGVKPFDIRNGGEINSGTSLVYPPNPDPFWLPHGPGVQGVVDLDPASRYI